MLEKLLSGETGPTAEYSTVATRLPKRYHVEFGELCKKHGLTIQSVAETALMSALDELRQAPVRSPAGGDAGAKPGAEPAAPEPAAEPEAPKAPASAPAPVKASGRGGKGK